MAFFRDWRHFSLFDIPCHQPLLLLRILYFRNSILASIYHTCLPHAMSLVWATPYVLPGVLRYSTGQKWSPCYQKVHANRVRAIGRHLCVKPRTFEPAKKICLRTGNLSVCVMRVHVTDWTGQTGGTLGTGYRTGQTGGTVAMRWSRNNQQAE